MSASLLTDMNATLVMGLSLPNLASGTFFAASGVQIGLTVDMLNANVFTNVQFAGLAQTSGDIRLQVQTSDFDTSGSFTDPTSGLAQLPTWFQSGGQLIIGGSGGSIFGATLVSGQILQSGFVGAAAFQRPARYARINLISGTYQGVFTASLIGNQKTTGSGGGFNYSPTSGVVNV